MELLGRVLGALKRLKPQLQNTGSGSVQIGKAAGAVNVVNVHQQVEQMQGSVTHHHVQVHQHFYAAPPTSAMCPPPPPAAANGPRPVQSLSEVHREVLTLMDPLPKRRRIAVLDFMSREFGTRMVKELHAREAHRVRLYINQVRANRREVTEHDFL